MTDKREAIGNVAIEHHHTVADVFEEFYENTTDRFENAFAYGRHKVDLLLDEELKKLAEHARVLDAGCGTGHYVARMRGMGFDAQGVEPAEGMRERAERLNPMGTIFDGTITDLPFSDDEFDLVMSIEVFRYLHREDVLKGMAEMMRVLKPGGRAFITFVNRHALDGFWLLQKTRQLARGRSFDVKHPHCEFTTPREVERDLRRAGASHVRVEGRLLGPMRLVYKVSESLGAKVARVVEPYDDMIHEHRTLAGLAGHLVAIATK